MLLDELVWQLEKQLYRFPSGEEIFPGDPNDGDEAWKIELGQPGRVCVTYVKVADKWLTDEERLGLGSEL